jgi:uncharacterized protein (DUF427 family)
MVKAVWKDQVLAESQDTIVIEGNHYFPLQDVKREYLVESDYRSTCPWKGEAHYYDLMVNGEKNENAAWYYPQPKEKAQQIKDHVAFWKGVSVEN